MIDTLLAGSTDASDGDTPIHGCTRSQRVLNKRVSRVILYGHAKQSLVDRYTVLQRCVDEMSRLRDTDHSERRESTALLRIPLSATLMFG